LDEIDPEDPDMRDGVDGVDGERDVSGTEDEEDGCVGGDDVWIGDGEGRVFVSGGDSYSNSGELDGRGNCEAFGVRLS
jgi:hypothetical protein